MFGVVLFLVLSLNRPGSVWCSSVSGSQFEQAWKCLV